ncbi:MAG TPA: hypothetical protein VEZ72_24900 [Paenibacillus sp.]|nr:hypothetical protein [Paenibacillus sp.]
MDDLHLDVALLRSRVPNLTVAARAAGLRPATVSNLCTGKIPIGRAEVRTLALLASLAGCTMDELVLRGGKLGMIETGIKALDLLAPVVRGGTVGLVARPGTGQMALLAELLHRLRKKRFATVYWKPVEESVGVAEAVQESESSCGAMEEVYRKIVEDSENRDVVVGADRTTVLSGELFALRERLVAAGIRPVTTILVDARGEAADEETPYGPLDTYVRFDAELTTRGCYPSLDPVASTSTYLEGAHLEPAHALVQQQARRLLRRYRELRPLVIAGREALLSERERSDYDRGERLEAYLTQPFFIAEPYTGKAGEWVPLRHTVEDVRAILEGEADRRSLASLTFRGSLERASIRKEGADEQ